MHGTYFMFHWFTFYLAVRIYAVFIIHSLVMHIENEINIQYIKLYNYRHTNPTISNGQLHPCQPVIQEVSSRCSDFALNSTMF